MKFTLLGLPIPQPRPRFRRNGDFIITYSPNQKEKNKIKNELKRQIERYISTGNLEIYKITEAEAFAVKFIFYFSISDKESSYKKNLKLWGFIQHVKKPDCDNLEKFYLDCANKILWKDDCQIVKTSTLKKFCEIPRTEIFIKPVKKIMNETENFKKFVKYFSPHEFEDFMYHIKILSKIDIEDITNDFVFTEFSDSVVRFAQKFSNKLNKLV